MTKIRGDYNLTQFNPSNPSAYSLPSSAAGQVTGTNPRIPRIFFPHFSDALAFAKPLISTVPCQRASEEIGPPSDPKQGWRLPSLAPLFLRFVP